MVHPPHYDLKSLTRLARQGLRKLQDSLEGSPLDSWISTGKTAQRVAIPVRSSRPANARQRLQQLQQRYYSNFRPTNYSNPKFTKFQGPIWKYVTNFFSKEQTITFKNGGFKFNQNSAFKSTYRFKTGSTFYNHPNMLYKTFYGNFTRSSRNFSSYSSNITRDAVQNLTQGTRAFFNSGYDQLKTEKKYLSNAGNSVKNVNNVIGMIKNDSTNEMIITSCIVEFKIALPKFSIPSINFLDVDYMEAFNNDIQEYQKEIATINKEVQSIFENFGSLPVTINKTDKLVTIRIHFINQDSVLVENLLKDAQVTRGVIHETTESVNDQTRNNQESSTDSEFTSYFSFNGLNSGRPPSVPYSLISSSSTEESESEFTSSDYDYIFFPVLSSSESMERSRNSLRIIDGAVIV